jgi:hypothetical protein
MEEVRQHANPQERRACPRVGHAHHRPLFGVRPHNLNRKQGVTRAWSGAIDLMGEPTIRSHIGQGSAPCSAEPVS